MILSAPLLALTAQAGHAIGAEEFDALTRGKTMYYAMNGQPYGIERYLPNRRVQWSFLDGECVDGVWYEQNGQICFAYEVWEDPQCWVFTRGDRGLLAEFADAIEDPVQYEAFETQDEMQCLGPKVGV